MSDTVTHQLVLGQLSPHVYLHLPVMVFIFCFGACVGSFLNVVIYRLPAGMSVISPPSRCTTCGARLRFFRENLPIIGWLAVRGRCLRCGAKVSAEYMIVELIVALTFVGLYTIFFMTKTSTPWWGSVGGLWWTSNTVFKAWPAFTAIAFLVAGLMAMTAIDARTFTIPIQIPTFVTVTAFIVYPLQALIPSLRAPLQQTWPIPATDWTWFAASVGGMAGVVVGMLLLRAGLIKYSFEDYDDYVEEGETLGDYPHARRETIREIGFLLPTIIGIAIGLGLGRVLPDTPPPIVVQAIGGTFLGYLSGAGIIWAIRILGTLGFGREAMGLGDVHMLGAVGAVLGWFDPIVVFFVAPFSGIAWVIVSMPLSKVFRGMRRELPYGPHLAIATLALMLCRPGFDKLAEVIMPGVALPQPGLVERPPRAERAVGTGADNLPVVRTAPAQGVA